jgi:ATP-binding cassette, subfamily B, bacterial PglK
MFKILRLVPDFYRKNMYLVILLMIVSSVLEIIGVSSLIPFFKLILDPSFLDFFKINFKISGEKAILLFSSIIFLFFIFKNYFSIIIEKRKIIFSQNVFKKLSNVVLESYVKKGMNYINTLGSSKVFKNIYHIPFYFSNRVLLVLFTLFTEIIISGFLILGLLYYNYKIFLILSLFISPFVFFYYRYSKKRTLDNGKLIDDVSPILHDSINNFSFGFRDIVLFQKQAYFKQKYFEYVNAYNKLNLERNILLIFPNKFIDIIICFCLILIVNISTFLTNSNEDTIIILLSFGIISFRIIPSINRINASVNSIRIFNYTIDVLENEIVSNAESPSSKFENMPVRSDFNFQNEINLKDIFKSYNKEKDVLKNLQLTIKKGDFIGVMGESGSGKTTLISIILNLVQPDKGFFYVDNIAINSENNHLWQNKLGYVSQDVFILNASIKENIAFGIKPDEINHVRLENAIEKSFLRDFISQNNKGVDLILSENGENISGGQKQRIGIARALYSGAEVLIFDESTSSLDENNEINILKAIHGLSKLNHTIIMVSHKLNNLRNCNKIYTLKEGGLILNKN